MFNFSLKNLLSNFSPVQMFLFSRFSNSEFVGEDTLGNRYFRAPARKGYKKERRWVLYKSEPEASLVPPEWHGWLHHQTDVYPMDDQSFRRPWQKQHQPNMTGTTGVYRPPGHILSGGKRQTVGGDYEPWQPPR